MEAERFGGCRAETAPVAHHAGEVWLPPDLIGTGVGPERVVVPQHPVVVGVRHVERAVAVDDHGGYRLVLRRALRDVRHAAQRLGAGRGSARKVLYPAVPIASAMVGHSRLPDDDVGAARTLTRVALLEVDPEDAAVACVPHVCAPGSSGTVDDDPAGVEHLVRHDLAGPDLREISLAEDDVCPEVAGPSADRLSQRSFGDRVSRTQGAEACYTDSLCMSGVTGKRTRIDQMEHSRCNHGCCHQHRDEKRQQSGRAVHVPNLACKAVAATPGQRPRHMRLESGVSQRARRGSRAEDHAVPVVRQRC